MTNSTTTARFTCGSCNKELPASQRAEADTCLKCLTAEWSRKVPQHRDTTSVSTVSMFGKKSDDLLDVESAVARAKAAAKASAKPPSKREREAAAQSLAEPPYGESLAGVLIDGDADEEAPLELEDTDLSDVSVPFGSRRNEPPSQWEGELLNVDECLNDDGKPAFANGLCQACYRRELRATKKAAELPV